MKMMLTNESLLIQLIRKHLKLVLEHGQPNTTKERRESIRNEIVALRIERDELLNINKN